ncbi:hypothetical protein [Paenibacillus sp. GCM10027626]|uniref:hypothetical protein n=1 Tax=Paenibacillus sp. GCM10027626 TaxID=3273411 RepID=UPI00363957A7
MKNSLTMNQNEAVQTKRLFSLMNVIAWICLAVGVVMCAFNLSYFSDANLPLMLGIGFMIGSVFIYTIATAINMVETRKLQ